MFYFIRHGQTQFNVVRAQMRIKYNLKYHLKPEWLAQRFNMYHVDSQLTQNGKKQAEGCRQKMANQKIDLVLVSPLRRALQTCDIIFRGHKDKPRIIVQPNLRQYFQSTCDIGGRMIQSMKQFDYFDFSLINDPQVWYIHHIFDQQVRKVILQKLQILTGQQRYKKGLQLSLQFLKQWHTKVIDDRQILAMMYVPMRKQRDYIKSKYLIQGKNIAIVSHSQNLKVYFNKSFANCEIYQIPQQQL